MAKMKLASEWNITVLPKFRDALPPQTRDEAKKLEQQIVADGWPSDPLVVWRRGDERILVDGHHRHAICKRHNLPFAVRELRFDSEADVLEWMVSYQLARRNLSSFAKVEAVLGVIDTVSAGAKHAGSMTTRALGDLSGTSAATVTRVRAVLEAAKTNKAIADKLPELRAGTISVTTTYESLKRLGVAEVAKEDTFPETYTVMARCTDTRTRDKIWQLLNKRRSKWGFDLRIKTRSASLVR